MQTGGIEKRLKNKSIIYLLKKNNVTFHCVVISLVCPLATAQMALQETMVDIGGCVMVAV